MRFINTGGPIKIRIGKLTGCYWKTIKKGEVVDLSPRQGRKLKLMKVKTTEGQIGQKKVETKQIYTSDNLFLKELIETKGIGKKTAKDIVSWGTKEKLIQEIKRGGELPFRDDVAAKLKGRYGA